MFFELIGTIMAGIAAALFVWAIRRWKPAVPSWLVPASAGAAMIAAAVSSEYGWYGRVSAQLPDHFVVARTVEGQAPWRPWSYVVPNVERFVAIDKSSLRKSPQDPAQRMVDLYFFGRWAPLQKLTVLWDCTGNRTATVVEGAAFAEDGSVTGVDWQPIPADDPVRVAACAEA
jgi:hypothetical protein